MSPIHDRLSCSDLMVHNATSSEATSATVIFSRTIPDLALLRLTRPVESKLINSEHFTEDPTLSKSRSGLCKGTKVFVVGFGLQHGDLNVSGPLVCRGVVSKVVCDRGQPVMFVTTAAVNAGMSGGLVADAETGALLGMVVSNSQ